MSADESRRRRKRFFWLALLVVVLIYPVLLVSSTRTGLTAGLQHDVSAERQLLRALNYAGDQVPQGGFGTDTGQPAIAGLDPAILQQELLDRELLAGGSAVPGGGPSAAVPGQVGTGGNGGAQPAPVPASGPPVAPPPAGGVPPPLAPGPSAPPTACSPPTGKGSFDSQVRNAANNKNVGSATVHLYWNGCLVFTGTTKGDGHLVTPFKTLAANTTYTYTVSAPGYVSGSGTLTSAGDGKLNQPLLLGS